MHVLSARWTAINWQTSFKICYDVCSFGLELNHHLHYTGVQWVQPYKKRMCALIFVSCYLSLDKATADHSILKKKLIISNKYFSLIAYFFFITNIIFKQWIKLSSATGQTVWAIARIGRCLILRAGFHLIHWLVLIFMFSLLFLIFRLIIT